MERVLLCLHGWGGSKESFTELRQTLEGSGLTVLTPDLPGFGDEPEPPVPWTLNDYAEWAERQILERGIERLSLLGHSHGGRISIAVAARGNLSIDHLYLCAASGIRHRFSFKRFVGGLLAAAGKTLFGLPILRSLQSPVKKIFYKILGEHDYERATPVMKKTLANVVSVDVRPLLPKISVPTDLFWGEEDTMTPLADGRMIREGIRGSTLHAFPGVRHRVHRDRAAEIAAVIRSQQ